MVLNEGTEADPTAPTGAKLRGTDELPNPSRAPGVCSPGFPGPLTQQPEVSPSRGSMSDPALPGSPPSCRAVPCSPVFWGCHRAEPSRAVPPRPPPPAVAVALEMAAHARGPKGVVGLVVRRRLTRQAPLHLPRVFYCVFFFFFWQLSGVCVALRGCCGCSFPQQVPPRLCVSRLSSVLKHRAALFIKHSWLQIPPKPDQ